jgi:hypothetical protein
MVEYLVVYCLVYTGVISSVYCIILCALVLLVYFGYLMWAYCTVGVLLLDAGQLARSQHSFLSP